ncbi:Crp/Fnr family transcriptional regulator [Methylocella tundrae]|uniref:Crp/Fnr family transcriptional regulator n=1 Tax=Methylocella tundrae TaxID=227605 RepID=A0A4U8YVU8_METTU|nr:Crp/Fnr family transcriptional regulator [Methylocella tundrae]WPP05074.1 Crp/Fnr family transcriptional regulator [Methylocella tundrae]VFU07377.1 Crp/Fnr family transcriptional regulator [Methylocella tundrae]
MTTIRPSETLARVELFHSLPPDTIARLDTRCIWRRARAKEWIIDYQDESTDVFFLITGVARVMIRSISGRETILRDIEAGAFFGELAAIDGQTRSASILAITDATIAKMTATTFIETVTSHPDVSLRLLRFITGQVRMLANRVNEFTTLAIRERLITELLRLSRANRADPREAIVSPPPVHADLAGRISTRRETVTKELSAMEREGLVRRGRGALTLVDVPRLVAMIGDKEDALDFKT